MFSSNCHVFQLPVKVKDVEADRGIDSELIVVILAKQHELIARGAHD